MCFALRDVDDEKRRVEKGGGAVLRTGSMDHPPKSSSLISILFSKLGKIGLKKMLGGVGFPHWTFFSPGASFSQWTFQ